MVRGVGRGMGVAGNGPHEGVCQRTAPLTKILSWPQGVCGARGRAEAPLGADGCHMFPHLHLGRDSLQGARPIASPSLLSAAGCAGRGPGLRQTAAPLVGWGSLTAAVPLGCATPGLVLNSRVLDSEREHHPKQPQQLCEDHGRGRGLLLPPPPPACACVLRSRAWAWAPVAGGAV